MRMFSKQFWIAATERAAKTFAQTFLALAGAQVFNVITADWAGLLGISAGAAVLSYMMSLVSAEIGDKGTPSLVKEEQ